MLQEAGGGVNTKFTSQFCGFYFGEREQRTDASFEEEKKVSQ
jgi:hypothetical protein